MIEAIISGALKDRMMILIAAALIAGAGVWAYTSAPLDAIPDLSDVQVIVYTDFAGQAPQVVEDQVTYPLSTAMLVPGVSGFSR